MKGCWRNLLPLTVALFVRVGDCQRDFAGQFEQSPSFRAESESRETPQLRFRNQGSLGPTNKVFSLFQVHSPPSPLDHVPATPQSDVVSSAWMRNLAGRENRKPHSAPTNRKLHAPTNIRSQSISRGTKADAPGRSLSWTPQRQRMDISHQWPRNGPRARTAAQPRMQNSRSRMAGPNVCGGQCCSGWTTAPGTNRCIKPVCDPPCQNKGSCSRPQLCVCRSGFRGSRCEEVVPEQEYHPPGLVAAFQPPAVHSPLKRMGSAERESTLRDRQLPTMQKLSAGTQSRSGSLVIPQLHTGPSRTVRRYPAASNDQLASNALPNGNGFEQISSGQRTAYQEPASSLWGVNLTEKIRKIKIVFTPTICKQTCQHGRCYNSCERGDTTTLYSQGGHDHDPKSGFRIYFCQIPCLNGGRCVGRDECWCPSNSTGKFCHLAALKVERKKQVPNSLASSSMKHSMYTLPLSNQLASINPSLVNVHINHPPEAAVQIHQVARVKSDSDQSEENSVETVLMSHFPLGSQFNDNATITTNSNNIVTESNQQQRPQGLMGKCYLETVHGKCANPLLGLANYEDCCGSMGAFWGISRCIPCPSKPAHPVIENGQVECPQGYKKLNRSHCQDINECLILGICNDAECVNTRGSFLCTCKPGTMLDPSRSHCISDKAVSTEQGLCYRSATGGVCALPLNQHITKQICCCSRVGKGWGTNCEKCPLPGSETFKEICPAGHGYTYSSSDIYMSMRKAEADELPLSSEEQKKTSGRVPGWTVRQQLQEVSNGGITDALPGTDISARKGESEEDQDTDHVIQETDINPVDVVEISPHFPAQPFPGAVGEDAAPTDAAALFTEMSACSSSPNICGPGTCVNLPGGYACLCYPGYQQYPSHTYCIDVDECERNPCDGKGHCINNEGSYSCLCFSGYALLTSQNIQTCYDLNECDQPNVCHRGKCINTPGSYICECKMGYIMGQRGQCEDIDECATHNACPRGLCINSEGSFSCVACGVGYIASRDGRTCEDIDECVSRMACPQGICTNTQGSFTCQACDTGYILSSNKLTCEDINECEDPNTHCLGGECLNTPGSYRCHCRPGFELCNGTICEDLNECLDSGICSPNGECLNSHGSYFCICPLGFSNAGGGVSCQDVDECADQSRCLRGQCLNTEGSYSCLCQTGFRHSQETDDCIDIDECANETLCGPHGFCANTDGSFHCLCDRGYENSPSGHDCIDVNECEMMVAVCGTALCENVDGAFLCLCPSDHEEYDTAAGVCRPRAGMGEPGTLVSLHPGTSQRKECYYHISDIPLCDSVLANSTTKEECCCTEGAAWGDNCETHPCPVIGSVDYIEICPSGKGYILVEGTLIFGQPSYTDADECEMFGPEVCRNGHCVNTVPGYTCFCHAGYFYDSSKLECVDLDECENEEVCTNGKCLNTAGSYHCFCSLPLVLDATRNRCVNISNSADDVDEHDIHLDICWQRVSNYICSEPLLGQRTTYTECCCRYGDAWSQDCAFCPPRSSEDFAQLCNVARSEAGLRDRPGYEYGPNQEDHQYGLYRPDLEPYYNQLGLEYGALDPSPSNREQSNGFEDGPSLQTPQLRPAQTLPRYLPGQHYSSFEGLQAEECGILNGCDNGRCVRVQEGYTCDCFDGFQLDLLLMACVDVNECEEASASMTLCEGSTCENTEGSYRCNCLPGYVALAEPHRCVPETVQNPEAA
ncbi:latent-transforming growth factor beta-binding protein 2 isoform X2 [Rhineura floridana]|uniref:latent-transforming growth factor beta-binding protein 2 isoform X2 n=1 Tax=Rhineura floridana TaxID=261503 RepID=UPI002AC81076|nr:latent-transforming growth factor beta-binding protein 2 isoform X2 [Rhineura floridana]